MSNKVSDRLRSYWVTKRMRQPWGDAERTVRLKRRLNVGMDTVIRRSRFFLERGRKWLRRRRTQHPTMEKFPVFIVGSNRSGTQMVCEAIGKSPHGWNYRESEFSIAFNSFHLRADWLIRWLIRHAPAPLVSFGSILDSQSTDELLSHFEGARAIWIYRRYQDAANSSVHKWGSHLKDLVHWVARGEPERLGARGTRISADTVRLFGDLFNRDLSNEDGASLYWYMRNQLYFDLNLHRDPRVLIVQYEDTVLNKEKAFQRIFGFLGFPYDPAVIDGIFGSSVGKHRWPGIDTRIQEICDALQVRLDEHYAAMKNWIPGNGERPPMIPLKLTHSGEKR